MQEGIDSNAMICDYKMVGSMEDLVLKTVADSDQIDTDYFLPVLMQRYFLENPVGRQRAGAFLRYDPRSICHGHSANSI